MGWFDVLIELFDAQDTQDYQEVYDAHSADAYDYMEENFVPIVNDTVNDYFDEWVEEDLDFVEDYWATEIAPLFVEDVQLDLDLKHDQVFYRVDVDLYSELTIVVEENLSTGFQWIIKTSEANSLYLDHDSLTNE